MTSPDPRKELASTYFVQDRRNQEEMQRVHLQDRMFTAAMGGPLPEQADPRVFRRVLDVGCGTGDWLIETARTYPDIQLLIGVDISDKMVHYARWQIEDDQRLSGRVEFAVMDALRMLEFQEDFFDLVNARLAMSYLRTWEWRKFMWECVRVCRPGGVIRVTESDIGESNSQSLNQFNDLIFRAFCQSERFFTEDHQGVTSELPHLFKRHGLEDIQTREHIFHYRPGTQRYDLFVQDTTHSMRTLRPFLQRYTQLPDNYDELCQQALHELQDPGFLSTWRMVTCWGTVPRRNNDPQFLVVP